MNLKKFLMDFGLNMDNLRGQGYDGTSNMSGHMGGLQALIKVHSKYAHYVHCYGHKLNLVVDGAIKGLPAFYEFVETIRLVRNLVTGSSKRHNILENALNGIAEIAVVQAEKYNSSVEGIDKEKGDDKKKTQRNDQKKTPLPELNATHSWSGNQRLVNGIYDNLAVVCSALTTLIDDEGTTKTQAAEMEGALHKLLQHSFIFCVVASQ